EGWLAGELGLVPDPLGALQNRLAGGGIGHLAGGFLLDLRGLALDLGLALLLGLAALLGQLALVLGLFLQEFLGLLTQFARLFARRGRSLGEPTSATLVASLLALGELLELVSTIGQLHGPGGTKRLIRD